jgi:hypothetical protein
LTIGHENLAFFLVPDQRSFRIRRSGVNQAWGVGKNHQLIRRELSTWTKGQSSPSASKIRPWWWLKSACILNKEWHNRLSTIDPILSRRITNHGGSWLG